MADWLRNPWGILHGGVTACMVDVASELSGSAILGRPVQPAAEMVRYLGRAGSDRSSPSPPCWRSTLGGR